MIVEEHGGDLKYEPKTDGSILIVDLVQNLSKF